MGRQTTSWNTRGLWSALARLAIFRNEGIQIRFPMEISQELLAARAALLEERMLSKRPTPQAVVGYTEHFDERMHLILADMKKFSGSQKVTIPLCFPNPKGQ